MSLNRTNGIAALALTLLLQACAGGGETGTGVNNGGGTDVSVGTITAFGSVWVNGVEFETGMSQVSLEGASSSYGALKVGMVVTVKGTINADGLSGTADAILAEEVIKGPIDTIGTSSFTVLGQQVIVNEATLYETPLLNLGSLSENNDVEVSGIVKSAGVITATRVERKDALSTYKLKGVVSNTLPNTFVIGALTVNYAGVAGLPSGVPADGMLVEVKGSSFNSSVFIATSLEAETLDVEDADQFEIEGYVGAVSGGGASFTVNNVTVQTTGTTEFSAGLITDLADGVFVEVEGALQGGIVSASEVKFREGVKLESYVTAKTSDTLTLDGLGGLSVAVDGTTEYSGVTGIVEIVAGSTQRVSVRGRYDANSNKVIATRIEVEVSDDLKVVLQGPVSALPNPAVTLMGISVDTTGISSFDGDGVIDQGSFFTAVSAGDVVNVEGTLSGGVVTWESIELED